MRATLRNSRQKRAFLPAVLLLAASCGTAAPPALGQIELRTAGVDTVSGNTFECTGTWPSTSPCSYPWSSSAASGASFPDADHVRISLFRVPWPIDTGSSDVVVELRLGGGGPVGVTAELVTDLTAVGGLPIGQVADAAVGGYVEPILVGRTPTDRSTGRFWLAFSRGTISGTYDTAPPP